MRRVALSISAEKAGRTSEAAAGAARNERRWSMGTLRSGSGSNGDVPGDHRFLEPGDRGEQDDADDDKDQQRGPYERSVQRRGGSQQQVAETSVGADELGHDGADDGGGDGDFQAAEY